MRNAPRRPPGPVKWQPPPRRPSDPVDLPVEIVPLPGHGPEDVLITRAGDIVTGLENGDILLVRPDGGAVERLGNTGGRPLGIEEFFDGSLLVCDHDRGLLHFDIRSGKSDVLVDEVDGHRLHFCSNAVICGDGSIYFTSSSDTATVADFRVDAVTHATSGRLMRYDPGGRVTVLRDDLAFANGIALAPDESYVLVAESIGYRILRYWLTGPRAGQWDDFVTGTPGFLDNISLSDGLVWVCLPTVRVGLLDFLLPRQPVLRSLLLRLPQALQPQPESVVWVQAYDLDGNLVHDIRTRDERFGFVTAAAESGGSVWLSSIHHPALGRIRLT